MACRMRSGIYRQALASGSHCASGAGGERLATGGLDLRREMPSYHNRGSVRPYEHLDGSCLPRPGIAWRMLDLLTAAACGGCLTVSLTPPPWAARCISGMASPPRMTRWSWSFRRKNLNHKEESRMKIGVYGGTTRPTWAM